jgi:hypothetical protein
MAVEPRTRACFFVRITRHGAAAFGWEICRAADSTVIHRAAHLFGTRFEAIADSARAAEIELSVLESGKRSDD